MGASQTSAASSFLNQDGLAARLKRVLGSAERSPAEVTAAAQYRRAVSLRRRMVTLVTRVRVCQFRVVNRIAMYCLTFRFALLW